MGSCSIKSRSCRLPSVLQALAWGKPIFYVGLWAKKMQLKCIRWKTILSQVLLNLVIRKKKPKKSLQSWKNSQDMGLTVPMPMPILPWLFRWPISRSIIQMFSLMSCSIIRAAIIWQMLFSLILKSRHYPSTPSLTEISSRIEKSTWE